MAQSGFEVNIGALELALMLGLPLALGAGVVRVLGIGVRTDPLAFFGWAWIAGSLGTGLVVFAWLWTGAGTGSVLGPAVVVGLLAGASAWLGRRVPVAEREALPRAACWERSVFGLVLVFAIALVAGRIVHGTLMPVLVGDEGEFWALKSKIIFTSGGFNEQFRQAMSDPQRIVYHEDYPILNPLLQVWAFAWAGEITHVVNRLPFQIFALAQLLVAASALLRVVRPLMAALLLLILLAPAKADEWTGRAMADLMVSVALVTAFDALHRWHRLSNGAWFGLGAVAVAFALWAKNEGFFYLVCVGGAIAVSLVFHPRALRSRRLWRAAPWLLLPAGVLGMHWWFNARHGFLSAFSEPAEGTLVTLFLHRVGEHATTVLDYFGRQIVFNPGHSNLVPACFFALLLLAPALLWKSALRVSTLAFLFAWGGLMAIFVAHPTPPPSDILQQLRNGAPRVSFQLYAVSLLWIGSVAGLLSPRRLAR